MTRVLRIVHRGSAAVLCLFLLQHIANHLVAIAGAQTHIEFMRVARAVYRMPIVEGLLLLCVCLQIPSGLWAVVRGWRRRRGAVAWLQACSGLYLAFFLLVHVGAVLYGRFALDLDTNFYFAAAGLHVVSVRSFFYPYYFLSIAALATHLGCALYWRLQSARARRVTLATAAFAGCVIALVVVLSFGGFVQPVQIPAKYKASYAGGSEASGCCPGSPPPQAQHVALRPRLPPYPLVAAS